jgi:hypothetical protein
LGIDRINLFSKNADFFHQGVVFSFFGIPLHFRLVRCHFLRFKPFLGKKSKIRLTSARTRGTIKSPHYFEIQQQWKVVF